MGSFYARRPLGTMTTIAVTLVVLLAPFSVPAQTADAPPSAVCAQPVLAGGASSQQTMDRRVSKALKRATRNVNAEDYTDARAWVGQLDLDQLTPYELAMAEGVLFRIADAEQKYDEARQHVVRAIESCGLTDEGVASAQDAINRIDTDARLAATCGGDALCASTRASTSRPRPRQTPYTTSPWPNYRSPPVANDQTCRGCTRAIDGPR
jgi:hypothetical protein